MVAADDLDGLSGMRHQRIPFTPIRLALAVTATSVITFMLSSRGTDAGPALLVTRTDDPMPSACAPNDCSLREAIIASNDQAGADTITLPPGTYTLTRAGAGENGSLTGDLDVTGSVTINGGSATGTIIDGGDIDRVLHVLGGAAADVTGVTLEGGNSNAEDGGGVQNFGTLAFTDSVLRSNTAEDGGALDSIGTLTIVRATVIDNQATDVAGGIQNVGGSLTMTDSMIVANVAPNGGGGIRSNGTLTANRVTISGNSASAIGGGALLFGMASFRDSTISGNGADGSPPPAGVGLGGGLNVQGTVTLTNVTVASNFAGDQGGNLFAGPLSSLTVTNTIIANSVMGGDCSGTFTSGGHNIDSDGSCNLAGTGDQPNTDPLIDPLSPGLGLTWTHPLQANSPAIDSGDGVACGATDQRSISRPLDGDGDASAVCDAGAVEAGPLDADGDGCTDEREAQTRSGTQVTGGLRDPDHFWDFFDVPAGGALVRDKSISAIDIFAVIGRFGTSGDSNIPPLSMPPPAPAYHTAYDRGPLTGPDVWDLGPADGSIASTDIFAVLGQFSHACS